MTFFPGSIDKHTLAVICLAGSSLDVLGALYLAVHMDPEDALRAHAILGAQTSIAIHHGTFQLADEGIDTPARRLAEFEGGSAIRALKNGESAVVE